MTYSDIAILLMKADRYQNFKNEPQQPNGSTPGPDYVNPHCPEGMDITGMTEADFHIIPVSKGAEKQVREIAFRTLKEGYGMTRAGDNSLGDTIYSYCMQIPPKDRAHAAHTLHKIYFDEVDHLVQFMESKIPGWRPGNRFDTGILDEYQQGIDVKA